MEIIPYIFAVPGVVIMIILTLLEKKYLLVSGLTVGFILLSILFMFAFNDDVIHGRVIMDTSSARHWFNLIWRSMSISGAFCLLGCFIFHMMTNFLIKDN